MVIGKKVETLGEWAMGKPLGSVIIAQQAAGGAEACFEFLKLIKTGERIEGCSSVLGLMNGLVYTKIIDV